MVSELKSYKMNDMEANYRKLDEVIISGTLTGIGDVKGIILEVEYNSLSNEYFYQVKSSANSYWCQERYLKIVE